MSVETILEHPRLGPIRGAALEEGGIQFRNLLYATIPDRWHHSIVVDDLRNHTEDNSPYDATQFGPLSPQPEGMIDFDFNLIQKRLPMEHDLTYDDKKCLNLVLTKPITKAHDSLPVVVFIHGGGFFIGGNAWPQYASIGKPIIGIGINYRLGLLGFQASHELDNADTAGNYGFNDQANALRWIQNNIAGFNGDPNNVTIMGESAGAISVWMQFLRGEPIFTRGLVMSGDPRLRRPQTLEKSEAIYQAFIKELGAENISTKERVDLLRSLPWQRIIASPHNTRTYPTLTGGIQDLSWGQKVGSEQIRKQMQWCKTLVIGDCEIDASAMVPTFLQAKGISGLKERLSEALSPQEVQDIVELYRLNDDLSTPTGIHPGIIEFVSDVRFYMPVVKVGQLTVSETNLHVYHFHEPNPFDGPFTGRAGHVLDVAFTLQTYHHLLPKDAQTVSREMGKYVIELAYGALDNAAGRPTGSKSNSDNMKTVLVWDNEHRRQVMSEDEYDKRYRRGAAVLLERIGIEKCSRCLDLYQGWTV